WGVGSRGCRDRGDRLRARPRPSTKRQRLSDAAIGAPVSSLPMPRSIGAGGPQDRLTVHVAPPVSPWHETVACPLSVVPLSVPVNVAAVPATTPVSWRAGVRQSESWNSMDPVSADPCCWSVRSIAPWPAIPTRSHCPVQVPDRSVEAAEVLGASEGVRVATGVGGTEEGEGSVEPALLLQPLNATTAMTTATTLNLMAPLPPAREPASSRPRPSGASAARIENGAG